MTYNFDEIINRKNTNSIKYDELVKYFKVDNIKPLWVADMDFKTPSFIVEAIQKRVSHEIYGYTFRDKLFYESIVNWQKKRFDWIIKEEDIEFSPGVVPAFSFLIECLSDENDGVIIQTPVYFPFYSVVKDLRRDLIQNPLKLQNQQYVLDLDDLENKIDKNTKLLLFCNPHNPVGRSWSEDELRTIGEFCLKNKILIISDEIHSDFVFEPNKHIPMASISKEISEITVTIMSPSKTFNLAGLSTAYVISTNRDLLNRYKNQINRYHLNMGNIFGFEALKASYLYGELWLDELKKYLEKNILFCEEFLRKNVPAIKIIKPQATYLLWLDCRDLNLDQKDLNELFINKAKIALSDGALFGENGKGFMRMNIALPKGELEKVLEKIKEVV